MKMLMLLLSMLAETPSGDAPDVQLLDFTASYCQPCRQMVPILNRMESNGFPIRRIDITEEPDLSRQFRVEGVPTLVIMSEGKEVQRFVGLTAEEELRAAMNRAARDLVEKRKLNSGTTPTLTSERPGNSADSAAGESAGTGEVPPQPELHAAPDRSSGTLVELFRRMFGDKGEKAERPTIRGQSPGSGRLSGLELAAAATVRVNVEGTAAREGKEVTLRETGTGTIISSEPGSTVILTCAHFFLGLKVGDTVTRVEVFRDGVPQTFPAKVLGGDHGLDLAVLKITTPESFPAVTLSASPPMLQPDQLLSSFGCDGGAAPSQKTVMLIEENRYEGPGNLVCSTEPASGRSGGGIFDENGNLVGVCSCRNQEKDEGLYMAWSAINALLIKLKLTGLQGTVATAAEQNDTPSATLSATEPTDPKNENSAEESLVVNEVSPAFDPLSLSEIPEPGLASDEPDPAPSSSAASGESPAAAGPEVTIIIDDKTAGAQKKVIVIPRASPWLMEMLTGEATEKRSVAAMKAQRPTASLQTPPATPTASKAVYQE